MEAAADRRGNGLVLVGYRGTGKTTVGRIVAERLGRPFADTDVECQAAAGCSIAEFFAREGEAAFRDLEERSLIRLTTDSAWSVLATGGGIVLRPANLGRIRDHGMVLWLTAPPEVLAGRIALDPQIRPALTTAGTLGEIVQVLAVREPLYREAADEVVATEGRSPEEVADRILSLLFRGSRS